MVGRLLSVVLICCRVLWIIFWFFSDGIIVLGSVVRCFSYVCFSDW